MTTTNHLQVGIDFSQKKADLSLLFPDGQPLEPHVPFANSLPGYSLAKQLLLDTLDEYAFDGIDVSGEATGYFWLPFFLQLAVDPDLAPHDLNLFLLNPRWVKWFKKCFAEDAVAKIAGLWWPRADSGNFQAQDRRMAKSGNRYLRYYLIQAADRMRKYIPEYAAYYARKYKEAAKHHHKRALVLTARKSVGLVVGLLHRNESYRSKEERCT